MTEPINVRVDLQIPAAYVSYRDLKASEKVHETREVGDAGAVFCDLDDLGAIIGLEVLWIDVPSHVETARSFAVEHRLAFPRDLGGNLVAA